LKVTVGGREQIFATTLLIPNGEDAWIEFAADTWNIRLNIVFVDNKEDTTSRYDLTGNSDHGVLTLQNWNNSFSMGSATPISIGHTDKGRNVCAMINGHSIEGTKKLDISFFWEK